MTTIQKYAFLLFLTISWTQDYSLYFDGIDDYIEIADNPIQENTSITYSFWMYWDGINDSDGGAVIDRNEWTNELFSFYIGQQEFMTRDNFNKIGISIWQL